MSESAISPKTPNEAVWEPKNSEQFVGYFATQHFQDLINTGAMKRVFCFYGGEAADVNNLTIQLETITQHEDIWQLLMDNPARVYMAAWMWLDTAQDTHEPIIAATVISFIEDKTEQFALPYRPKTFLKPFQIKDPITYQVTGALAENGTFYMIALFELHKGARANPLYDNTWGKYYVGELFRDKADPAKIDAHPNSLRNMYGIDK